MNDKQNILVIEDSLTVLKMIKTYLQKVGYLVQTCVSTEEAYKILKYSKVNFVLCDIVIESKEAQTGYHILKFIKGLPRLKHIPVFMMTDRRNLENAKATALRLGADGFLEKPFKMEALEGIIKKSLGD